ncbi:MAG: MFS transporter [Bacillota bacterium]
MRLNYGRTFTLGLGFMVISITWSIYNAFVPVFYERFVQSGTLIGLLMITDNIIGITLQPWISHRSDKTWNRFGRRMPYILIGAPLGAVLFGLIPFHTSLWMLVAIALAMNVAMGLYRAPTVALMPDITPRPLRSQANGIINFMGGLGALIAFFLAAPLFRKGEHLPFLLAAVLVFLAVGVLYWRIKEPRHLSGEQEAKEMSFTAAVGSVFGLQRRSVLYLLLAIFAWFVGYQGLEAFFTLYSINVLGVDAAAGAFTLGFFALAFLAFAIPAGFIAGRFGRRNTIRVGLGILLLVFAAAFSIRSIQVIQMLFLLGGFAWALVNVNSYPMVVEMASDAQTGTYTGLYYFFSSGAAIVGPPLMGFLRDLFGYEYLFIYAIVPVALAFILIGFVRGGEALTGGKTGAGIGAEGPAATA